MDIRLPRKLKILSYYLPSLYIVGGYVRNSLLELPVSDVDLAAEYTVQELATALSNTEFLKRFQQKTGHGQNSEPRRQAFSGGIHDFPH
ncbi:MAG: hypothetical protein L6V82_04175 [Clostridiales bacterium]|nr:MAG: hypothetical protein L6V82_04175 [Clostridiales bacterium]